MAASTVSRALTRPGRVAHGTAERIRCAADQLGFRMNPLARALPTGRTSMLALIVPDVTDPGTAEVVRGAQEAASEAGYTTLFALGPGSQPVASTWSSAGEAFDRALGTVDGALLMAAQPGDDELHRLAAQRPLVLVDRVCAGLPGVVPDIADGMRQVVAHLAARGHELVTYVAGPSGCWADGMRRRALRQAGCEFGVQSRRIGPFPATIAGGMAAAGEWLRQPATAIIAYDDLIAIGLIRALTARGIQVPQEVNVVGFGNVAAADLITPGLTTVAAPLREMGAVGVRQLLGLIEGLTMLPPASLPVRLVERGSTGLRRRMFSSTGRGHFLIPAS